MPASYRKSDAERRNRVKPKHDWTALPAEGRKGAAPKLPAWRQWNAKTKAWWRQLWAKPQAVMWQQDGSTLWTLAVLYDDLITGRTDAAKVSPEMRQHEDRHGLNPKAMQQMLWKIVEDEISEKREATPQKAKLRAVDTDALAGS